jgi:hypothetical protein
MTNRRAQVTPVAKSWQKIQGRTFLVEAVPLVKLAAELNQLPAPTDVTANPPLSLLRKISSTRLLTPQHLAQASTNTLQLAKSDLDLKPSVVLDYLAINSNASNFTFQSNTTYYVSGSYNLTGTTTVEGGAVIKYANNGASLSGWGPMNFQTAPYRTAMFTIKDDDTAGEIISGSSGSPVADENAGGIYFDTGASRTNLTVHDVQMRYLGYGIESIDDDDLGYIRSSVRDYSHPMEWQFTAKVSINSLNPHKPLKISVSPSCGWHFLPCGRG